MPLKYTEEQKQEQNGDVEGEATSSFTVEEAIEKIGFGWLQLRIYLVCKLIVATDAMEVMLLSLIGPVLQCYWSLHESQVAFMSTAVFFGMTVASPLAGLLADRYGRRTLLLISTVWTAFFGLLTTFSPFYVWLLILRGLVGVGMGGIPQGYAMVAEYVPSKFRAKMIVFSEVLWGCGSLFEILLAALVTPTLGWRWLFAISSIPVFIACVGLFFLPESARFLVAAGRSEEALKILQRTAEINRESLPPGTIVKSKEMSLGSLRDLFSREYRLTTILLWPIWFGASFGYYGIVLASPLLLSQQKANSTNGSGGECNVLDREDYVSLATSTVGEFAGLLVSFLLIDRIGRRWTGVLLLLGAAIFLFLLQLRVDHVLLTLFIFGARGTTLTVFNLFFIYTVEVYPTTMRALSVGMAVAWARLASMITPFFAQVLMVYSVPITVTIYGVVCLLCALFTFLLPIETMGRPMMQSVSYEPAKEPEETTKIISGNT
ncbi:synaptic vesicle 2-related protein-like [Littorina saxatilis]|uniref:Major facilitator superfamily (MFS) profile domain-containing protein n=1 Tax=Littorina saxatilis TaxID=31220 RepID=A0AAN9AID4_9CAEN